MNAKVWFVDGGSLGCHLI